MPTPALPPTPATSTDIPAKDENGASPLQPSLCLPPPALQPGAEQGHHPSHKLTTTPPLGHINSDNARALNPPISAGTKTRRPIHKPEHLNLPSPPTRSRKIIQMKPLQPPTEPQSPNKRRKTASAASKSTTSIVTTSNASSFPSAAPGGSKPTKKAIRKTAHSLIERRRRSKMNDAFSTLKDMIPACQGGDDEKGREMHKLDVLNAGIEYLAYLERCLARVNERSWGGVERGEDAQEIHEDGGLQEQEEEQEHSRPKREALEKDSTARVPAQSYQCHCRCHGHSPSQAEPHARTSLPLSPPPSSEPRPQDHYTTAATTTTSRSFAHSAHVGTNEDRNREQDHDAAATVSTAAALLMLTSTDRRDARQIFASTTVNRRGTTGYHQQDASAGTASWNHDQNPDEAGRRGPTPTPAPRLAGKAGLSVRDLLSSV